MPSHVNDPGPVRRFCLPACAPCAVCAVTINVATDFALKQKHTTVIFMPRECQPLQPSSHKHQHRRPFVHRCKHHLNVIILVTIFYFVVESHFICYAIQPSIEMCIIILGSPAQSLCLSPPSTYSTHTHTPPLTYTDLRLIQANAKGGVAAAWPDVQKSGATLGNLTPADRHGSVQVCVLDPRSVFCCEPCFFLLLFTKFLSEIRFFRFEFKKNQEEDG